MPQISALIASIIILPLLSQAVDIVGYNDATCNPAGGIGVLARCRGGRNEWYTYGSVSFSDLTDLDTSFWTLGPYPGCTRGNVVPPRRGPGYICLTRPITNNRWGRVSRDLYGSFVAGGALYQRDRLERPAVDTSGFPGDGYRALGGYRGDYVPASGGMVRRLRLRAEEGSADDQESNAQACPADAGDKGNDGCGELVIPTIYGYPEDENDKGVWILDPLPEDKFKAYEKETRDDQKSQVDIMKAYGARWVEDRTKEPEFTDIGKEGASEGEAGASKDNK
ncbi:MAG: hypothetical protein Q9210_000528 [Variospora velana]